MIGAFGGAVRILIPPASVELELRLGVLRVAGATLLLVVVSASTLVAPYLRSPALQALLPSLMLLALPAQLRVVEALPGGSSAR